MKSFVQPRSLILALACVAAGPASSRVAFAGNVDSIPVPVEWQAFTQPDALPDNYVRTIHVSGDHVWVGTDGGLARFDGKKWEKWTVADGLPWPAVSAIAEDARTGDVWVGTWGGGLARLSGGRFDVFDQLNSGLAGNLIFSLALFDGQVWAGTNGGLSQYDVIKDRWQLHMERRADRPESAVTALFPRPNDPGELLAGCWCEGLKQFDNAASTWRPIPNSYEPDSGSTNARDAPVAFGVLADAEWWASPTHVHRRVGGGQWKSRVIPRIPNLPGFGVPRCLAARNDREAWVATEQGLLALVDWDSDTWVWYCACGEKSGGQIAVVREQRVAGAVRCESSLLSDDVRCVAFQGDVVWVGTRAGLVRTGRPVSLHQLLSGDEAGVSTACRAIHPGVAWPTLAWPCPVPDGPPASASRPDSSATSSTGATYPASPPPDPEVVAISVAGATTRTIPLAGGAPRPAEGEGHIDLLAVKMAIDDANAHGGYRGRHGFAMANVPESYTLTRYGWGLPEDEWVHAARRWGAVAGVTYMTPSRRIESAAARSTELPLVNVARTSPTADEVVSGAVFRPPNDDEDPFRLLLQHIRGGRSAPAAVLIMTVSGAPAETCPWVTHARALGIETVEEQIADSDGDTLDELVNRLAKADVDVVLTCDDWTTSAAILRRMRQAGMDQPFVGDGNIIRGDFAETAGATPGVAMAVYEPGRRMGRVNEDVFNARYAERFLRLPGRDGYASYRATIFLLEAIDLGGLERPGIRNALDTLSRAVAARLENGRWVFMSAADLASASSEVTRSPTP